MLNEQKEKRVTFWDTLSNIDRISPALSPEAEGSEA